MPQLLLSLALQPSAYGATKAAVRSFARYWTLDLERKIRVNAISPGMVPTPGYDQFGFSEEQAKEFVEAKNIPLGRVGTPDEIAKAVVFLASDDSSFVTALSCLMVAWHKSRVLCPELTIQIQHS